MIAQPQPNMLSGWHTLLSFPDRRRATSSPSGRRTRISSTSSRPCYAAPFVSGNRDKWCPSAVRPTSSARGLIVIGFVLFSLQYVWSSSYYFCLFKSSLKFSSDIALADFFSDKKVPFKILNIFYFVCSDGRAKPIDLLAKYISAEGEVSNYVKRHLWYCTSTSMKYTTSLWMQRRFLLQ